MKIDDIKKRFCRDNDDYVYCDDCPVYGTYFCVGERCDGRNIAHETILKYFLEQPEYQSCDNCKYENKSHEAEPCCNCTRNYGEFDMWEKCDETPQNPVEKCYDPVNRPSHYTDGKIEVIEFIEDKKLGFHLGNAIKYISRAGKKNPDKTVEDLRKAIWYIERHIKTLEVE